MPRKGRSNEEIVYVGWVDAGEKVAEICVIMSPAPRVETKASWRPSGEMTP